MVTGLNTLKDFERKLEDSLEWGSEGRWIESTSIDEVVYSINRELETPYSSEYWRDGTLKIALRVLGRPIVLTFPAKRLSTSKKSSLDLILINIEADYREFAGIYPSDADYGAVITVMDAFKPIYARMEGDWSLLDNEYIVQPSNETQEALLPSGFWKGDLGYTRLIGRTLVKIINKRYSEAFLIPELIVRHMSDESILLTLPDHVVKGTEAFVPAFAAIRKIENLLNQISLEDFLTEHTDTAEL
jgi:hypothetical protein